MWNKSWPWLTDTNVLCNAEHVVCILKHGRKQILNLLLCCHEIQMSAWKIHFKKHILIAHLPT